jgi:hypothetical protein
LRAAWHGCPRVRGRVSSAPLRAAPPRTLLVRGPVSFADTNAPRSSAAGRIPPPWSRNKQVLTRSIMRTTVALIYVFLAADQAAAEFSLTELPEHFMPTTSATARAAAGRAMDGGRPVGRPDRHAEHGRDRPPQECATLYRGRVAADAGSAVAGYAEVCGGTAAQNNRIFPARRRASRSASPPTRCSSPKPCPASARSSSSAVWALTGCRRRRQG